MKRLETYNLSFGKTVFAIALSVALFLVGTTNTSAAVDFSVSLKAKSTTTASVTIKNNVQSSVNNEGNYRDMVEFTTAIIRDSDGVSVASNTFRSAGKEQKDVSFTGLAQNTSYTAQVLGENKTTAEKTTKTVSFKTTGTAVTTPTGTILPVEFVKPLTVLGSNAITVTVRNKSTKPFEVTVVATDAAGGGAIEKKTTVAGGADAQLFFTQGVINGKTYNLVMTGKQVGASTTYQPIKYDGLKLTGVVNTPTDPTTPNPNPTAAPAPTPKGDGTCKDGEDNSTPKDGKADYYGVDNTGPEGVPDGRLDLEPDPSCISPDDTEKSDLPAGNLLSCYNYCTFSDVLKTINNLITFLITKLFIPILVLLFMFAGVKYITAQGNPAKVANIKKMVLNIIIGLLLVLCSWLIVKVILRILVKDSDSALQFLE